jgi:hypothetical protein
MPVRAVNATPTTPGGTATPKSTDSRDVRRASAAALVLLLLTAVVFAVTHMDQGVDTWISLAGGRDVAARGVRTDDPFSFASRPAGPAGAPAWRRWLLPDGWINQNWLTHLLLHRLAGAGGTDALVWWKLLTYLLAAAALVAAARLQGASLAAALAAAAAALAAAREHLSLRAQDVTNLLAAAMLLVLALARSRGQRWLWALVPLFAVWANAHGGFVFGLALLAILVVSDWRGRRQGASTASGRPWDPRLTAAVAVAALAAAVTASPYRLANLTHPLAITVGPDSALWRVVREWRPLFSTPLASPWPVVALAVLALGLWAAAALRPRSAGAAPGRDGALVVSAFALAIASARFVPLACVVVAPSLAGWLDAVLAPPLRRAGTRPARLALAAALWLAALAAAAAVATRTARTYLAPWPQDAARHGVFDRMTHGHQRPWGPCAFLAANGVRGRLWNFWDEGGFLAACQQPEAGSGAVPVRLFIDGRAQAAFDAGALRSYLDLLNGPGRSDTRGAGAERVEDLVALREWTARRLRELEVGFALVPAGRQRTAFARAVAGLPGWQVAYVDGGHTLFADGGRPEGGALLAAVAAGAARFPDEASAALTAAMRLLPPRSDGDRARAVALAAASYRARPASLAVLAATRAAGTGAARADALALCRAVAEEFAANRDRHRAAHGYGQRLDAAVVALEYLAVEARKDGQDDLGRWATSWLQRGRAEQQEIVRRVLW